MKLGDYLKLQPPLKAQVFKSGIFNRDADSEVILQYIALPDFYALCSKGFGEVTVVLSKTIFWCDPD